MLTQGENVKNKANILILSPFIYPEPISTGKYNTFLAKALSRKGFSVEIISFYPLYPDWKNKRTNKIIEGVKIYRGGGLIPYPKSQILRRILLELNFFFHCIRQLSIKRNYDYVIPIFPPSLLFFIVAFFFPRKITIIGIIHDIQGVLADIKKSLFRKTILYFIRLLEKKSYSKCDKLIFLSKSMADRAEKDYRLDQNKISISYPFITLNKNKSEYGLKEQFTSQYIHVVYSGAIGEKQNPFALLEVYQGLVKKRDDIICHFFSRGPLYEKIKSKNNAVSNKIIFHDLVPEKYLYELYDLSDVQIIPQSPGSSDGAIPSKLPNLIYTGTSIFAICDSGSELAKIIEELNAGRCVFSWNIDLIVNELSKMLKHSKEQTFSSYNMVSQQKILQKFHINQLINSIFE